MAELSNLDRRTPVDDRRTPVEDRRTVRRGGRRITDRLKLRRPWWMRRPFFLAVASLVFVWCKRLRAPIIKRRT
jgi:hypothetical protein